VTALSEVSPSMVTAWEKLSRRAVEPNPFFGPELVLPAAGAFDSRGCYLVTVSNGDRLLACLPVRCPTRWGLVPLPLACTWRHQYCFLGTPLVDSDPATGPLALHRLLSGLRECPGRPRVALLESLSMDGILASWMRHLMPEAGGPAVVYASSTRGVLDENSCRQPDVRLLRRRLRLRRRLERELGAPLQLVQRPDAAGVEAFLKLEASGWKGRQGTALVCRPTHAELVRQWCASLAEEGRLQALFLQVDERPIAAQLNVLDGNGLFGFKVAYEEGLAHRSPGVLLELEARELWCASGPGSFVDSCAGQHNEVVNRVFPGRRTLATLLLPLSGFVSSAAVAATPRLRKYARSWRYRAMALARPCSTRAPAHADRRRI
jgi:CelD/BcsL family acetyltransferase involved in cellulose biosynthesis